MIDALIDTLDHGVRVLLSILGPELSVALLVGLLFSGLTVFFLKATPRLINSPRRVLLTRLWAVIAAFVPTFLLYRTPELDKRLLVALVAGFAAPVLYQITVRIWPAQWGGQVVRKNLSGDPKNNEASHD